LGRSLRKGPAAVRISCDAGVFSLSSIQNGGEGWGEESLISRSFFLNQHPEDVPALAFRSQIRAILKSVVKNPQNFHFRIDRIIPANERIIRWSAPVLFFPGACQLRFREGDGRLPA
jgi:hypothetical protein